MTILCITSYEKGHDFLRECNRQGWTVVLITAESIRDKAHWPMEAIDEIFYLPDDGQKWNPLHMRNAVSYLARTRVFDRIVALDDFDIELGAMIREHLRIPGMGETTARYFRDKLAMRTKARDEGLAVPDFIHVLNHARLGEFFDRVPPPWVLKPRSFAGSIGIKKIHSSEEFWSALEKLGDQQSYFLLEQYVPGDIYHVDSIFDERQPLFAIASRYGRPPMDVSHEGDIFTTRTLPRGSDESRSLIELNEQVLKAFGLLRGVSHSEFIRGRNDGKLYFLETSARVGGAHIADLIEAATGINMWREWAKLEIAGGKTPYQPPTPHDDSAGLLISLARQEQPDTSAYNDPEIVWRMDDKKHHVGLIVKSRDPKRVEELMWNYAQRFRQDFFASAPPKERPTD